MDQTSYLEQCIRALPIEKQAGARKAFEELGEGDLGTFSRVLIVLEATSAFAKEIPQELEEVSKRLLTELDARRKQDEQTVIEREKRQDERMKTFMTQQVPALGRALAVDKLATQLEHQKACAVRMERSIERLRHLRVGGVLALMAFSVLLVGGILTAWFWSDLQMWRDNARFFGRLDRAGIGLRLIPQQDGSTVFRVSGPVYKGTAWREDERGRLAGADFVIQESH